MPSDRRLAGLRILVPESRELDLFCQMLEAEGAVPQRCPLVAILDLEDPAPVLAWLDRLISDAFDDLILLTGEGLRRIITVAQHSGREAMTTAAIGRLRTITRGPKPVRALREIGLGAGLQAPTPTTDGVIAALAAENLDGRQVGVQLYPGNPNEKLVGFLKAAGASVEPVTPYRYASDVDDRAVIDTIHALASGAYDLIAFTSSPQVDRLAKVATANGLAQTLAAGLGRTRIAAVGPLVAEAVRAAGGEVAIEPPTLFHLKPLVTAIAVHMAASSG